MNKLLFSLPDTEYLRPYNLKLLKLIKDMPELFYDDFIIGNFYGNSGTCIWNGGRSLPEHWTLSSFQEGLLDYKSFGVSYNLTCTNLLLSNSNFYDVYANKLVSILYDCLKYDACITLSNTELKDYIENTFGIKNFTYSVQCNISNKDDIDNISKTANIVLPIEFNQDLDFLKSLDNPENIVLIGNESCIKNCPFKKDHYMNFSKFNMYETFEYKAYCANTILPSAKHLGESHITRDCMKYYSDCFGINNFKLIGRMNSLINFFNELAEYFVLPENLDKVKELLNIKDQDILYYREGQYY